MWRGWWGEEMGIQCLLLFLFIKDEMRTPFPLLCFRQAALRPIPPYSLLCRDPEEVGEDTGMRSVGE